MCGHYSVFKWFSDWFMYCSVPCGQSNYSVQIHCNAGERDSSLPKVGIQRINLLVFLFFLVVFLGGKPIYYIVTFPGPINCVWSSSVCNLKWAYTRRSHYTIIVPGGGEEDP